MDHLITADDTEETVTLERDDILGVIETEPDELVPLMDDFISSVCQDIHNRFPKSEEEKIIQGRNKMEMPPPSSKFQVPSSKFMNAIWISCANIKILSASTNTTWVLRKISSTKFTSKCRIRFTEKSSKFRRPTINSLSKHWTNG
jgi:hypothetical protein